MATTLPAQSRTPRYRVDDAEPVVDIRISNIERLFDNRDPAPFRERDLDPSLVVYLRDAAEDLAAAERFRILFWLDQPCGPGEIETAFRAHFEYELDRVDRQRRRERRTGAIALAIAVVAIIVLVSLGELVVRFVAGTVGAGLKEGLVISGWVLMWKPVDVLVYDSITWRRERRILRKLLAAPIETRIGSAPPPTGVPESHD